MEEKISKFKNTWKYIVTGVTCAAAGVGITLGADAAKVQETISRAEAKQAMVQAAVYSAENILVKASNIKNEEDKNAAIQEIVGMVKGSSDEFIDAAKAVKDASSEAVTEIKTSVKETK